MGLGIKYGFCSMSFKSEMSQLHACQHLESVAHNQGCANNNYGRRVSYKITGIYRSNITYMYDTGVHVY